jgi:hypothetical protein
VLAGALGVCSVALLVGDCFKPARLTSSFLAPTRGQQLLPVGALVVVVFGALAALCIARGGLSQPSLLFVVPLAIVVADERVNAALLWVRTVGWDHLALGAWSDLLAGIAAIAVIVAAAIALARTTLGPIVVRATVGVALIASFGFAFSLLNDRYKIGSGLVVITSGGIFHDVHGLGGVIGADAVLATFAVGPVAAALLGRTKLAAAAFSGLALAALAHDNVKLHGWLISRGPVGARAALYVGAVAVLIVATLAVASVGRSGARSHDR